MFGLSASLSEEMFSGYVNQPLSFFNSKNSAYVTRNIIDFPHSFVSHVLFGIFTVFFRVNIYYWNFFNLYKIKLFYRFDNCIFNNNFYNFV